MQSPLRRTRLHARLEKLLGSRGAASVETALMFPILFAATFGLLELGLLYKDLHVLNESTRAAARLGSTLSREPGYDISVLQEFEEELANNFPSENLRSLVFYDADPDTSLPRDSGSLQTCTTDCYRYNWNEATGTWDHVVGTEWPWDDQRACGRPTDNDYLGVHVEGYHPWVTQLFGEGKTVTGRAIFRLEPVTTTEACS